MSRVRYIQSSRRETDLRMAAASGAATAGAASIRAAREVATNLIRYIVYQPSGQFSLAGLRSGFGGDLAQHLLERSGGLPALDQIFVVDDDRRHGLNAPL